MSDRHCGSMGQSKTVYLLYLGDCDSPEFEIAYFIMVQCAPTSISLLQDSRRCGLATRTGTLDWSGGRVCLPGRGMAGFITAGEIDLQI